MSISYKECAPYLSTTLLRTVHGRPSAAGVRKALASLLQDTASEGVARKLHHVDAATFEQNGLRGPGCITRNAGRPPWYKGTDDLQDERHHIIFVAQKSDLLALTFSDPVFRSTVAAEIRKGRISVLGALSFLTAKQVNDAFVGEPVRTLWLGGAHRRTATKADSKILAGTDLGSALDPLEDQSYYFSSVRSTVAGVLGGSGAADAVVGANPRNARVWLGPSRSWEAFSLRTAALLDAAAAAIVAPLARAAPLPVLAQPIDGVANASEPYGVSITGLEEISAGAEDEEDEGWLHEFSDAVRFDITPEAGAPSFTAEVFWGAQSYGRLRYVFEAGRDGSVKVRVEDQHWDHAIPDHERIRKICEDPDRLTVYYDTGHTFSRGLFYATQFRDARFTDWRWVKLAGFDATAEKPLMGRRFDIAGMGLPQDTSLFGFIARHWPNFAPTSLPLGWLVCDDGAMESADFIHFDPAAVPPRLTLIHVKGSGSASPTRNLSVSDYEVVVGQAVKNLRYLDRGNIHEKLAANQHNQIGSAVWHDGDRQADRKEILALLEKAGSDIEKTVCVFQPSARRSDVEATRAMLASRGKKKMKRRCGGSSNSTPCCLQRAPSASGSGRSSLC